MTLERRLGKAVTGIIFDQSAPFSKQSVSLIVWSLNFMEGLDMLLIAISTSETTVEKLNGRV